MNGERSTGGWFKAMRNRDADELIRFNPNAYMLARFIAARARYQDGFNADGLVLGEAMLGDYKSYGMSERQYRTAKQDLQKHGFATFRTTNKGTIGKLIDTRLFDPLNFQTTDKTTGERRTDDGQTTTNKKDKKVEEGEDNHTHTLAEAELPTWAEVKAEADLRAVPEDSAKRFFDHHQDNSLWLNQHGRLINWKSKLVNWAVNDRQMKGNQNNANHRSNTPDRNAGTYNANRDIAGLQRKVR